MSKLKSNELIITLSCHGEDLYSLNTENFIEEISIGRNSDCTWSVGHIDTATSSRHAMISKRGNGFFLTDLGSRNGIYLNERRIKEVKLAAGMVFHFGGCSVSVTDPSADNKAKFPSCYLCYTKENGRRCKYKITHGAIKIGAGGKCDIVLNSSLVSTPHASLIRKNDGSCWLKDLNSRNGTSVNGLELPGKVERMLKNRDVISIADIEMTYHDGSSERHTLKLTAALLTLVTTILVCVGLYFFWLQFTPASQEFLQQARAAARIGDFSEARRLTASAASARKSGATLNQRKLFLSQIDTWEVSALRWKKLHLLLEKKHFAEAAQLLGTMQLDYISAWDWNEKEAVGIKKELELIKKLFSCFNQTEMLFHAGETESAELTILSENIRETVSLLRSSRKSSISKLIEFAENLNKKIVSVNKGNEACNKIFNALRKGASINVQQVITSLETLQKKYPLPVVSGRIEKTLPILYSILNSEKQMAESRKLFNAMRFKECIAGTIVIPENKLQLAGIDQRIARLRKESAELKNLATHLQILNTSLQRQNICSNRNISTFEAFLKKKELDLVFQCDSLRFPPVPKKRTTPQGQYDKYVGIEYLYAALVMFRSNDMVRSRYVIPFESLLERAVFHQGMITYFKEYTEKNCRQYISAGKLSDYIRYLNTQLALCDQIVNDMKKRIAASDPGKREYFIAHAIAYSLKPQLYTFAMREKISKEFSALRLKMQNLNRQYNTVLPQEAIKIREQVLKEGLPGDPVVKRMWSLR